MSRKVFCSLLILLITAATYAIQADSQWVKVAPPEGHFKVLMPLDQGRSLNTSASAGKTNTVHHFQSRAKNAIYWVIWLEYNPDVKINAEESLKFSRDTVNRGMQAKLLTENKITLKDNPGLEFKAESSDNILYSRVYVAGNSLYHLTAVVPKILDVPEEVDKFFSSFELTTGK